MYRIDPHNFFRLHQVRPRFKNDIENVLLFVATEISKLDTLPIHDFNIQLFNAIKSFPGNSVREDKTIHNWRTEIAALFGLIEEDNVLGEAKPSNMAIKLSEEQDLVQFFKYFLFFFQYPGGHIKSHKLKAIIDNNIKFKPAQYFLKVLEAGENITKKRFSLNKAEATHFIYNDLRVTRDNCDPKDVVERILKARSLNTSLDWDGDVIRYAGDILDYMVIANLLVQHTSEYYINWSERETIYSFISSTHWFDNYDCLYNTSFPIQVLKPIEDFWFRFINQDLDKHLFKTNIIEYLGIKEEDYASLISQAVLEIKEELHPEVFKNTKEIGDLGENLVIGHESMRIKLGGREDLLHLIKKYPTSLAAGFDIQSVELDSRKRFIEVKSTISKKPIDFYNFHLTPNEWSTAETVKDAYYVYRLMLSKEERKLFILRNPVDNYKQDKIKMMPRNGADIIFNESVGEWCELLIWQK